MQGLGLVEHERHCGNQLAHSVSSLSQYMKGNERMDQGAVLYDRADFQAARCN